MSIISLLDTNNSLSMLMRRQSFHQYVTDTTGSDSVLQVRRIYNVATWLVCGGNLLPAVDA